MKNNDQHTDEFYVGYLPNAPSRISKVINTISIMIGVIVIVAAIAVALNQRQFSTTQFEYGTTTTLKGMLFMSPVPHLSVSLGKNPQGREIFQNVLLVGSGKLGAEDALKKAEVRSSINLDHRAFSISGFLIYGNGKAVLQINDDSKVEALPESLPRATENIKISGHISIAGEIVDPKCYFGVMKPGEGKAHRSCAIRCIAGGIPPLFKSNMSDYFLLTDENFKPVNLNVLDIVGDNIAIDGELVEVEDWKILKVKIDDLKKISSTAILKKNIRTMNDGMTYCMN